MKVITDIRRDNLIALIKKYGSTASLNQALGRKRNDPLLNMIKAGALSRGQPRQLGNRLAREIEQRLELPLGFMDADHIADSVVLGDIDIVSLKYLDIEACCGTTGRIACTSDSNIRRLDVDESWFMQNVSRGRKEGFEIITAYGDSMNPTFNNGDCLIVDTKRNVITMDGVYCLAIDDELYIKRVQRIPNGYMLIPDNPRYQPITLTGEILERITVIGQIVTSLNISKYV